MYVHHMYVMPWRTEEDIRSPETGVTGVGHGLRVTMWVQAIESGSLVRAGGALKHRAISVLSV